MHLKGLTLRGFKSFAQSTTFAFEPGVTCIVGPNGSGKSNVVDALAWVMGEQGAKNLRGGSMADVIFAGTATRGPLGRAEVVLTIDNADGALPIEYTEVAISRILFRDGRSEYAINGEGCRLLDVQELLSDSGLGREMHVIVGQGQLDAVLRASPAERRGFIEEAAGILKHRRRKERTLRKLDAMQGNLARLSDLADELRRQLKPLGAQAEIAREAAGVQAGVREAKTRLLAIDALALTAALDERRREHERLGTARQVAEDAVQRLEARLDRLEREAAGGPLDAVRRTALQLEAARERFRSLAQITATRIALLAPDTLPAIADDGAAERASAAELIAELERRRADLERERTAAAEALDAATTGHTAAEARIAQAAAARRRHEAAASTARRAADLAASAARAEQEQVRVRRSAAVAADERAAVAAAALAAEPPGAEFDEPAVPDLGVEQERLEAARTALHAAEREQSALAARVAALQAATAPGAALADVLAALPGSRRLQDVIEVDPTWRVAVAAVLGDLVDAAVLPPGTDLADAARIVDGMGAVDLVAAEPPASVAPPDAVRGVAGARALLAEVRFVEDLPAALAASGSGGVAVTRAGEVVVAGLRLRTAGAAVPGVQLAADLKAAEGQAVRLDAQVAGATADLDSAQADLRVASTARDVALAAAREQAARARAADRRRAGVAATAEAAAAEARRAADQLLRAEEAAAAAVDADGRAQTAATAAATDPPPLPDRAEVAAAGAALDAARERALGARLASETLEERLRAERRRLADLQRRGEERERAAQAAARRAAERAIQREAAEEVAAALPGWQAAVDRSAHEARTRLAHLEQQRAEQDAELRDGRSRLAQARADFARLDREARDADMHAYEQQVSLAALHDRALAELGLDPAALAAEPVEGLDRAEEERRLASAERRLARLGRVNPLALEEYAALEQRQRFIADQLADLHRTRADLLAIVDELDGRMERIFADAFADTRSAFERIFPVLFPGGAGRLSLTDEEGEAGIEVAVRPVGKKIERLSLLSGGERSLAAVAFLLAIFTARPSPFYILDEVEAALDDANLGRLLDVISSLRDASQLILITHQKRTMEIADALYGVSMRQDGVSAVVGQRLAAPA